MPTCVNALPFLQPNLSVLRFAIFPFIVLPFVSQLAVVALAANKLDKNKLDKSKVDKDNITSDFVVSFQPMLANITVSKNQSLTHYQWVSVEALQVQWLMAQFNHWFAHHHTILVKGEHEPEYFAATEHEPAKIVFAHGFFASSLHEISHWCVAGKKRRLLNDFGYWYAPDGRNQSQQQQFEQVEIMPQGVECLLTLACNKRFKVSKDNLFADFDTSQSTFESDVATQAIKFWQTGEKLSTDAKLLLNYLLKLRPLPLTTFDIANNFVACN